MNHKLIADFIIKEVQEKSTGFQWTVSIDEIKEGTGIKVNAYNIIEALMELSSRKEVAGASIDRNSDGLIDGVDVVLYTDYAPNLTEELNIELDICNKCGGLMPSGRILCKECVVEGWQSLKVAVNFGEGMRKVSSMSNFDDDTMCEMENRARLLGMSVEEVSRELVSLSQLAKASALLEEIELSEDTKKKVDEINRRDYMEWKSLIELDLCTKCKHDVVPIGRYYCRRCLGVDTVYHSKGFWEENENERI